MYPRNFPGIYQEDTGKFSLIFSQYKYHENTRTSQPGIFPDIFTWKIPVYQIQCIPGVFLVYTREIQGIIP